MKFSRKSVSLSALWVSTNERLSDFYASSWQCGDSPVPMLTMRLLLAGLAVAILVWSLVEASNPYWLLYLTNWGLMLIVGMMLSGLVVSFTVLFTKTYGVESKELPWYAGLYWVVFNMAVTLSFVITCLYWILLYSPELREEMGERGFWLEVTTHGITSCVVMLELLMSRTPVRWLHIYQPLGLGLWYAVFSAIYYAAGGTDINGNRFIYDILDWSQGRRTSIVVIASMAGLILVYTIVWGIALCRDKISTQVIRTTSHDLPPVPPDRHMRNVLSILTFRSLFCFRFTIFIVFRV